MLRHEDCRLDVATDQYGVTMVDPSLLAALKILHTLKLMEALPYLLTDIRRLTQRLMKLW